MTAYNDAINYLYGLQKYGIKLGLEKSAKIASLLGNPHKNFLSIHVAGTNGKGSVSAMTASVVSAHGFKVGLFTSPHLVSFTERIRINNEPISESDVVSLTNEIRAILQNSDPGLIPTFFEFVTAMAFLYFARNNVDWAVVEVGMGGRLDATNIITPVVSVITKIGLDHKDFLGDTLKEIATEKAGIIKNNIPVISSLQQKEAEDVIRSVAEERSSCLFMYEKDFSGNLKSTGINGTFFDYSDESYALTDLYIPLAGQYQMLNACTAIKAVVVAMGRAEEQKKKKAEEKNLHSAISELPSFQVSALKDGLSNTKWHGRLEIVSHDPMIMIDGAHNPDAAEQLARFIKNNLGGYEIILILGVMSDKDITGIMKPLLPLSSEIILTAPSYGRAASPQMLAELASSIGFNSKIANSVKEAIEMAKKRVQERKSERAEGKTSELILITGSFYTIGEAMEALGKRPVLGTLRETV
jgi:dihydrofolate synthase/folylpolyglutamate synthase